MVPGQPPQVFASGFTNIIDIGFGRDGELYVGVCAGEGEVLRINVG